MAKKLYDLSLSVGRPSPFWMAQRPRLDRFNERILRHEVPIAPGLSRQVSIYWGWWHIGTHIDTQTHHVEGGMTSDKIPVDKFYGTGVIVDMRYLKKWDKIMPADLEKATPKIELGDVVLINTGWHHHWRVNDYVYYNHYPGLYVEAGEWLLERKVKMVGGTWGATDHPLAHFPLRKDYPALCEEYVQATGKDPDKDFPIYEPCHQIFCTNNIPHIEDVGGDIDEVTGKRCIIAAFPIKCAEMNGGMCRVVAIVEE